jgi:hypothetical protein
MFLDSLESTVFWVRWKWSRQKQHREIKGKTGADGYLEYQVNGNRQVIINWESGTARPVKQKTKRNNKSVTL